MAHRAYSRSAISADKSQIPPLSGNFQKLNKYGIYQTRYWVVNNAYLAYWYSKKDHDAAKNKPQAAFDLAASEEINTTGRHGDFEIVYREKTCSFKCETFREAEAWVENMNKRREFFLKVKVVEEEAGESKETALTSNDGNAQKKSSFRTDTSTGIRHSGWLKKKSPSRFRGWQERFCLIRGGRLFYFKKREEDLDHCAGSIDIMEADSFCIIGNQSFAELQNTDAEDTTVFRICHAGREYLFRTTESIANEWVEQIEAERKDYKKHEEAENAALIKARAPKFIREFDEMDKVKQIEAITVNIQESFDSVRGLSDQTIQTAVKMLEDLEEKASACRNPGKGLEPRLDVLAHYLKYYHMQLVVEMSELYHVILTEEDLHQQNDESSDEEKEESKSEGLGEGKSSSEGVGNASDLDGDRLSGHDLLRIMDWIVAYNELFHKIIEGTDIEKDIPPMEMDADLPKLADNYVRLIRPKFKVWVKNIGKRNIEREKRVRENDAGKLITPAPVELFNLLNNNLDIAQKSGVQRLRYQVLKLCLKAMRRYVIYSTDDCLRNRNGEDYMDYVCAMINDGDNMDTYLDQIETSNEDLLEVREEVQGFFDETRDKYAETGSRLVSALTDLIVDDVKESVGELFTKEWLDGSKQPAAVIIATAKDYCEDLKVALNKIPFKSLLHKCFDELLFLYFQALQKRMEERTILTGFARYVLSEDGVERVRADLEGFIVCFSQFVTNPERVFAQEIATIRTEMLEALIVEPATLVPGAIFDQMIAKHSKGYRFLIPYDCEWCIMALNARGDIPKDQREEIIGLCREHLENEMEAGGDFGVAESLKQDFRRRHVYEKLFPSVAAPNKSSTLSAMRGLSMSVSGRKSTATSNAAGSASHARQQSTGVEAFAQMASAGGMNLWKQATSAVIQMTKDAKKIKEEEEQEARAAAEAAEQAAAEDGMPDPNAQAKQLLEQGVITQEEYNQIVKSTTMFDKDTEDLEKIDAERQERERQEAERKERERIEEEKRAKEREEAFRNAAAEALARKKAAKEKAAKEKEDAAHRTPLKRKNSMMEEDLSGYLEKENQAGIWKKRWFVVRRMQDNKTKEWRLYLIWYETHTSTDEKNKVPIDSIVGVYSDRNAEAKGMHAFFMDLKDGKKYRLKSDTVSQHKRWENGLNKITRLYMEAEIADNAQEAIRELTMSFQVVGKATPRTLGKRHKYISPSPDKGASKRKSFVAHKSKRYSRHNTGSSGNSSLGALVVNAIKEDEEMGDDDDKDDNDTDNDNEEKKPTAATKTTTESRPVTKPSDVKLRTRTESEIGFEDEDGDALPTPPGGEGCCTIA